MQVAHAGVDTQSGAGTATLVALLANAHVRHQHRTALTCGDRHMTYAELHHAAGNVAAGLQARGIGHGSLVGICLERGFAMVIAMLGIIKAGAAYLPLDTRYPVQRLRETIEDAAPAAVIVEPGSQLAGLHLDELNGPWNQATPNYATPNQATPNDATPDQATPNQGPLNHRTSNHDIEVSPHDRAYVIYTSGSTGKPKGVEVTHANLAALLRGTQDLFDFSPADVWTMFHSFAFDFSVWEMWGCLVTGARLVIVPFEVSRAPDEFWNLLVRERVTVLNQTPSAFALLDRVDAAHAPGDLALRVVIFGGEPLAGNALRGWFGRHGDQRPALVNMYGITETTVHVTHRRMRIADADEHESLMGEAIPGWTLELIDEEIWVGGAGVAQGYLGRPELTAERFVGGLYRSGDLARRRPDGELVYLGRRDGQVKLNGFRIETGEVEAALRGCAGIRQACVLAREGRLVAYLVGIDKAAVTLPGTLIAELRSKLPAHMLPSIYVPLVALPLNANGKIDRNALPAPAAHSLPAPAAHSLPAASAHTATEHLVAGIWARLLGSVVSMDDNFFDVGGTSLLLIAARAALQEHLGRSIPVTWMFECTTVRTLAKRLDDGVAPATIETKPNAERQRQAFARAREARGGAR